MSLKTRVSLRNPLVIEVSVDGTAFSYDMPGPKPGKAIRGIAAEIGAGVWT